jgi:hypothetical protein
MEETGKGEKKIRPTDQQCDLPQEGHLNNSLSEYSLDSSKPEVVQALPPPPPSPSLPQSPKAYEFLFKFLLIGNSYVGKSSFITRFVDNYFLLPHLATIGVDFVGFLTSFSLFTRIRELSVWMLIIAESNSNWFDHFPPLFL